jgi:hypothetical protein
VLGSKAISAAQQTKANILWNVPVPPPNGASFKFKDVCHNQIQNYESRTKRSKNVTWNELVHVRTIEPCPGKGLGKWHQLEHRHRHGHGHHGGESKHNSLHASVTSLIFDL